MSLKQDFQLVCNLILVGLLAGANFQIKRITDCIKEDLKTTQKLCTSLNIGPNLQIEMCPHTISVASPSCLLVHAQRQAFTTWLHDCLSSSLCEKRPPSSKQPPNCDNVSVFSDAFLCFKQGEVSYMMVKDRGLTLSQTKLMSKMLDDYEIQDGG